MKLFLSITLLIFFSSGLVSCTSKSNNQDSNQRDSTINHNKKTMTNYYPFKISDTNGHYLIKADVESPELYPKYAEFFEELGYSGNGECWAGHIAQILEKLDPALLGHIEFDAEAGAFFANVDTKENQIKFVELLSPIFSDLTTLEEYVKNADRSQIDD